jgi:imidazolonepropionase-like amidohydrolase
MNTILTNCTVIECTGKSPMKDMTVVIEGEKIAALEQGTYRQAEGERDVRLFDLRGGYVIPGLWNCHVHLGGIFPDPKRLMDTESPIDAAIRAGRDAMNALRVGVTGLRVVGQPDYTDVAWRDAFNAGVFVGPRLFVCGPAVSVTGGWGHTDGPYEIRKEVREQLKRGVDQIKLGVTDGHGAMIRTGDAESMQDCYMLLDEVKAATEVAHQKGKRVCAHTSNPGMKMAIRGGVDCIEHGYFMDDETIALMLEHDVFYDPTLVCNLDEAWLRERGITDMGQCGDDTTLKGRLLVAKGEGVTREYERTHLEGFQKALKAGVKIVCGGDSVPTGEYTLLEVEHLVRAGMTEMEALVAATRTSADLCGVVDQLGTVEVDKLADLVVLTANPLADISNIRRQKMVLKGGKVVETGEPEGLGNFWELFFFE